MPSEPSDIFWAREEKRLLELVQAFILRGAMLGAGNGGSAAAELAGVSVDFTPINFQAEQWARQHSLELVKDITDETRGKTRRIFGEWLDEGGTMPELEKALSVHFDRNRARTIAVTETTEAFAEGNMTAWREIESVRGKRWMTVGDEDVDEPCRTNAEAGVIPLEAAFPTGDTRPPQHVNCRCWLQPAVEVEEEAQGVAA